MGLDTDREQERILKRQNLDIERHRKTFDVPGFRFNSSRLRLGRSWPRASRPGDVSSCHWQSPCLPRITEEAWEESDEEQEEDEEDEATAQLRT
jgi:hypothetical protein